MTTQQQRKLWIMSFVIIISSVYFNPVSLVAQSHNDSKLENDPVIDIRNSSYDSDGNLIVTGITLQENVYITKIDSAGTTIWEEFLGGSERDYVDNLLIDKDNNILLLISTYSPDIDLGVDNIYPFGGQQDMFIAKFNPVGGVVWSTYLGGNGNEWPQQFDNGFQFDNEGNIIIDGTTSSSDFTLKNAYQSQNKGGYDEYATLGGVIVTEGDLFITKLTPDGNLVFSTYYGGSETEDGYVLIDSANNIILSGYTWSTDIDASLADHIGEVDQFIAKFDPLGNLLWDSYYGGSSDEVTFIERQVIDSEDNIYIVGVTDSNDYPVPNSNQTTYVNGLHLGVLKINPSGVIEWGTDFGGSGVNDAWVFLSVQHFEH